MKTARAAIILLFLAVAALSLRADEATRLAQEELRKRNLYFGEVDGQMKRELIDALKRYQARKGFDVTGSLDEATANSLNISVAASSKPPAVNWPDVPVLKSDAARAASPTAPAEAPNESPPVVPAAETSPLGGDHSTPTTPPPREDVTKLVQDYLHDAATNDVDLQVRYYDFPVDYFDHGRVNRDFVAKDTSDYVKRWPERVYTLVGAVNASPAGSDGSVTVQFRIAFEVRNKKHAVSGKTENYWTLKPQGENLRIVAIKEQRLHE